MFIPSESLVFLTILGLAFSEFFDEDFHREGKNIFLDPTEPHGEHCRTRLGDRGRCLPLNDCKHLREYAEGRSNERLASIIENFGCGFRKVVLVCCARSDIEPFAPGHLSPHEHRPHHHGLPPPFFLEGYSGGFLNERPVREGEDENEYEIDSDEETNPDEKGSNNGNTLIDNMNCGKPVYEEPEEGEERGSGNPQNQRNEFTEGNEKDLMVEATTPLWKSSEFVVPQEDSWLWPLQDEIDNWNYFDLHLREISSPDWFGSSTSISNTGSGGHGHHSHQQGFQSERPNQSGFFGEGSISQGFGSSNRPNNQEFSSDRPGSGSAFERPTSFGSGTSNGESLFGGDRPLSQGFGSSGSIDRPLSQGFGSSGSIDRPLSQGFGSSGSIDRPLSQGFGSSGSIDRPLSQGFGGSGSIDRPLSQGFGSSGSVDRPSSQGFGNGRPGQSGLGNQGPQQFSGSSVNERPSQGGFGRPGSQSSGGSRPGSQSFGNERPFGEGFGNERPGNSGIHRPGSYDVDNGRPNNNRPGSGRPGSKRPTNQGSYGEEDSFGSSNQRPNSQRPSNQGSNKKPSNSGSNNRKPNRKLLPDGNCGTEISDKIIGGEDTKLDEFPWMALLHFSTRNGQDRGYGCGGSLINERYVLTAAHCIKGPSLPSNTIVNTVRLGEYDVTKDRDCINGVCSPTPIDAAVEEIIVHPEYRPNDRAQHHDIALIRLRKKVPFSTYVSPICLPGDELKRKDYSGKQLVVAGWGKTANGATGQSSSTKQKVSLPFVNLNSCKPFYEGINIRLRNTQMCAGGEKAKDSCQGDSGGPLMSSEIVNGQPSWFVTGIVSFGPEDCGIKNIAGVYTRVSEYVDWIIENMKE